METKEPKQRTSLQNRSLHLYFTMVADALNDAGLDLRKVLKESVDIPWTKYNVKEFLWKSVQELHFGTRSTTELTTKDIDKVYDTLNRFLGEKFGIHVQFPSIDNELLELNDNV